MAASGAGAIELTDFLTLTTSLRAFSAAGALSTLAEGSVDALRIAGSQILWTQAGVEHTAPLP